ncbi:hypothetical protein [Arthrobacter sp. UYEF13]
MTTIPVRHGLVLVVRDEKDGDAQALLQRLDLFLHVFVEPLVEGSHVLV